MSLKTVGPNINIFKSSLRPNNVTQYTAGDVIDDTTITTQTVFNNAARFNGGSGNITDAVLTSSANGTGVLALSAELWLFDTAVAAHEDDNAAFTPADADLLNLVGILQFITAFEGDLTAIGHQAVIMEGALSCVHAGAAGRIPELGRAVGRIGGWRIVLETRVFNDGRGHGHRDRLIIEANA